MARPKKDPADRRDKVVHVRLTQSEHEAATEGARERGISISDFFRELAKAGLVTTRRRRKRRS